MRVPVKHVTCNITVGCIITMPADCDAEQFLLDMTPKFEPFISKAQEYHLHQAESDEIVDQALADRVFDCDIHAGITEVDIESEEIGETPEQELERLRKLEQLVKGNTELRGLVSGG